MFPVDSPEHIRRIKNVLDLFLQDTQKAYIMNSDAGYRRSDKSPRPLNCQEELLDQARLACQSTTISIQQRLRPSYRRSE